MNSFSMRICIPKEKKVHYYMSCAGTEMKIQFIGLHVMGNITFPRIRLFWGSSLDIRIFLDNMARDRFLQLRNNLLVVDNDSSR